MDIATNDRRDPIAKEFHTLAGLIRFGLTLDEALNLWSHKSSYSAREVARALSSLGVRATVPRGKYKAKRYRTRNGWATFEEIHQTTGLSRAGLGHRIRNGIPLDAPKMSQREAGGIRRR